MLNELLWVIMLIHDQQAYLHMISHDAMAIHGTCSHSNSQGIHNVQNNIMMLVT